MACTCNAGFSGPNGGYGYLALGFPRTTATIIALVPGSPPRFASLSTYGSAPLVSASLPSYIAVGGPVGKGDMNFDRSSSQYLDGGAHTFNVASGGGFTAVAVVKFTGAAGMHERIFDFGNGIDENIILWRLYDTTELMFTIQNGATMVCDIRKTNAITQDAWITIIARYNAQNHSAELMLNGLVVSSGTCSQPLVDRSLAKTYVGKSNWQTNEFLSGSIAGLFVVDAYMDTAAATLVADAMVRGDDVLSTQCISCPMGTYSQMGSASCTACPANSTSPSGSSASTACICSAGFSGPNDGRCTECVEGKYTTGRKNAESCAVSGTFHGIHVNREYTVNAYLHVSIIDLFVFVVHDDVFYKMTAVTFADAQGSTTPQNTTDKYINPSDTIILLDSMTVSAMWDGTLAGYTTQLYSGYEVTNVAVSCVAGVCNPCPIHSNSLVQSTAVTACKCNAGSSGPDGGNCSLCAAGKYKESSGSAVCNACPDNSYSLEGSVADNQCECIQGYAGPNGGECQEVCGNVIKTPGEECDDGNTASFDGCSTNCTIECGFVCDGAVPQGCVSQCGDGILASNEICDDGNMTNGDGCNSTCGTESGWNCATTDCGQTICVEVCGNSFQTSGEGCDDGNFAAGDGCSDTCTVECGFSCNAAELQDCTSDCGDGILATDEGCDDNNTRSNDGCSSSCTLERGWDCINTPCSKTACIEVCGNGVKTLGEGCDDGNGIGLDGCDGFCGIECGFECRVSVDGLSECESRCGGGQYTRNEECDDGNIDKATDAVAPVKSKRAGSVQSPRA